MYGRTEKEPSTCGGIMSKPNLVSVIQKNGKIKIYGKEDRKKDGDKLKLRYGSKAYMLSNLFYNPHTPEMKDYYGKNDVYSFNYEDLHSSKSSKQQPVARPKSMVTGKEDVSIDWGVNWEDNAGGTHVTGKQDINFKDMNEGEIDATLKFRDVFYFYLPRICNHCVNPGCVSACPSGAAYKREGRWHCSYRSG